MNKTTLHERTIRVGQLCRSNTIEIKRMSEPTDTDKLARNIMSDVPAFLAIAAFIISICLLASELIEMWRLANVA